MGASGVGKDTFLNEVRLRYPAVLIAHRYITRPRTADGENHMETSLARFSFMVENDVFCMHWNAHETHYGIGLEVQKWLDKNHVVMVNGSRSYLPIAQSIFGDTLVAVTISADADILRQRLTTRGRETPEQIEKRIQRATVLQDTAHHGHILYNNTTMDTLMEQFDRLLKTL